MDVLKKKRGSVKAKLTIFEKFITNLEKAYPNYNIGDQNVFLEVEQRYERFINIIDDFEEIQGEIEALTEDSPETQYSERETFETVFFSVVAKSKRFLISNTSFTHSDGGAGSDRGLSGEGSVAGGSATQGDCAGTSGVKLPVIEIMTYNGEYDKWLEFRDTYESLIHKNSALGAIQKFHYLRSYLGPSVLEIIASLEISTSNYENAWELICNRFNNSRILIQNHVKSLFNINKISTESSSDLRKLVDSVAKHLRALKTLNEPTESWDTLVIYLITTKLDNITLRKWEQLKSTFQTPTLDNLSTFLKERADLLESLEQSKGSIGNTEQYNNKRDKKVRSLVTNNSSNNFQKTLNCFFCNKSHYISACPDFLKLNLNDKIEQLKNKRICLNCLKSGHLYRQCFSGPCKKCKSKHHTLLHSDNDNNIPQTNKDKELHQESINLASYNETVNHQVLLSTVLINVLDCNNKLRTARALLDAGSQSSFITEHFASKLNLNLLSADIKVSGINETHSECKGKCFALAKSKINQFSIQISCLIVPRITSALPNFRVNKQLLDIPNNVQLADPYFDIPGEIDLLIGADCFWDILCVGQVKLGNKGPYLQKTKFGWVVSGTMQGDSSNTVQCNLVKNMDIDKQLCRFWEIEDFSGVKPMSLEEKACEKHFLQSFTRDSDGRFLVTIPLLASPERLGDSYSNAQKRFLALERRFERNKDFKFQYFKFIDEYRSLGHMLKVDVKNDTKPNYYMPHHGVIKESSLTTKLRVVFDASCASTTGFSFNDIQMAGPTIQSDLVSILIRFRKHNFVIAADVEKMYRMCKVQPEQTCLQRILWREDSNKPIDIYELQTVTYGTKSASYLAIRCLHQLGLEAKSLYPVASRVILEDFYVDDLLTGTDDLEAAVSLANDVSNILQKSGFYLRKWMSNKNEILRNIENSDKNNLIDLGANENTKTLGLLWNGQIDCLSYKIGINFNVRITKRTVLSDISQIFDPLGLLSCTVILAKIILRDIWLERLGWDNSLPQALHTRWLQFRDQLICLNELKIKRQVTCEDAVRIELHGFSDSSVQAYGACVYMKSQDNNGNTFIRLISAKSKVAPLKTQTIPRLELTAALLLARLMDKVKHLLKMHIDKTVYWCDSTIVLGWLNMSPSSLQVFVGNRVMNIQELTDVSEWRHIPTLDNPADHISRGVKPSDLISLEIYWSGPNWLKFDETTWPKRHEQENNLPELRKTVIQAHATKSTTPFIDINKYSTLNRLQRVVAYCFRFKDNSLKPSHSRILGPLSYHEIKCSFLYLIKMSQHDTFKNEIFLLNKNEVIDKGSKLSKLSPFIDEDGILRVGGRLANSSFKFDKKHPIILSSNHHLTKLLFQREHVLLLHAGPQLLLASIRNRFWPIGGRNLSRKIFHDCVRCFKTNPQIINPVMGNLPSERITPAPPFFTTGIDYAGPFLIRDRQGRGFKLSKAYICLFICFTTKAIHLELASDLTTETFLAALRRFVSRRGKPAQVYSDNGSNFLGANHELRELGKFLQINADNLTESLENEGIAWSFIPPQSPHFGGLWEAGVKATKSHLKRIVSNASLTFERFYTLLVQIEAVLNSRPLSPLSSEPSDYTPLTPSHFLVGRPIVSVADPDVTKIPDNRLSHFQHIQKLQQHFWSRWSLEYISELQQRLKWRSNHGTLKVNDLVVIKDDSLPPCKWSLGRIECLHPGTDGVPRVATIRTRKGNIKRSFAKICPLPIN